MFGFFKKKEKEKSTAVSVEVKNKTPGGNGVVDAATGIAITDAARAATDNANAVYAKPTQYTGNRGLYDSGAAKNNVKVKAFASGGEVVDPYTGKSLELRKIDAKAKYGADWADHLAEGDHITPIEKVFDSNSGNPWLSNDDIRSIANSDENLETVSRKYNNAKRSRTNEEFVNDREYLEQTGVELTEDGRERAIESGKRSKYALDKKSRQTTARNIVRTSHQAGVDSAINAGGTGATISGILNITAVVKGEKTVEEAIVDTAKDAGKSAALGYVTGSGLTALSHTLESSSSTFLRSLSEANVPGKIVTAVMVTGNTIKRYCKGEISTQEALIEIGDRGLTVATAGYSMAVGQALIPIPVVGAAVGALVGSFATSSVYSQLIGALRSKQLQQQERERIIAECNKMVAQEQAYRAELEQYLESYFADYQHCFDEALGQIDSAMKSGDANGVIAGANAITRKLGGKVQFNNMDEFDKFLDDDTKTLF